jgi:hypothetical protein
MPSKGGYPIGKGKLFLLDSLVEIDEILLD